MSSVTVTSVAALGGNRWTIGWSGGAGSVDVWMLGSLLYEGLTAASVTIDYPYAGAPEVEIVTANSDAESAYASPFVALQWRRVAGAEIYRVEQDLGNGRWAVLATFPQDERGYYLWRSRELQDGDYLDVRLSAIISGQPSVLRTERLTCMRHPKPGRINTTVTKEDGMAILTLDWDDSLILL